MKKLLLFIIISALLVFWITVIKQTTPNTQLVQTVYAVDYTNALNPALKTTINKSMWKFVKSLEEKYPEEEDRIAYVNKLKKILILVSKKKYWMVKHIMEYIVTIL